MKTPEEILYQYFYSFPDGHEEDIIKSMKEYAKYWVEEAFDVATAKNEVGGDVGNAVLELLKQIDAQ